MNFEEFNRGRLHAKEWMRMNGLNEGAPEKNGEYSVFKTFNTYCDIFVDIGANNGIFIDELNQISLTKNLNKPLYVLAFEPNPNLKQVLERKIKIGQLVQVALSDKVGTAIFNVYKSDDTTSSLLDREDMMPHFTNEVTKVEIKTDILDSYLPIIRNNSENGVFIKIDVEGAELAVLKGACQLLNTLPKVFLMFEYSKAWSLGGGTVKEAFHLLDNLGLNIFRVTPLGLEAFRFYTPEMDGPDYCNYFAVKGFNLKHILECKSIPSVTHNFNDFYLLP
jgi:FkbM family methyltransferase